MGALFKKWFERGVEACEPSQVKLELNHACNFNCIHCYVDHSRPRSLSFKRICRLFDELLEMNGLTIAFSGGEPTLDPELPALISEASDRGFILELLTNGSRIDENTAYFFKEKKVRKIQVSLHGHEGRVHDAVTGVKGSFDSAIRGIAYLKAMHLDVSLACSLLKPNIRYWREIKRFADELLELPIEMSYWMVESPENRVRLQGVRLSVEEVTAYLSELYDGIDFKVPVRPTPADLEERICLAGINNCRILPNGDVIPCARISTPLGNLMESDFKAIWTGGSFLSHLRKLRRKDLTKCSACEYFSICLICPGLSYQKSGNFETADESVCQYVRADGELRRRLLNPFGKEVRSR